MLGVEMTVVIVSRNIEGVSFVAFSPIVSPSFAGCSDFWNVVQRLGLLIARWIAYLKTAVTIASMD